MPQPGSISVIVTTYNWPEALSAVLEALRVQDTNDFDVYVADDGSNLATGQLIERFRTNFPVALHHIWQPDEGPRMAAIRNRAIEATQAEYIVFIDGDCLAVPNFVSTHRHLAQRGWFVSGRRSWLRPGLSERVLAKPVSFAGQGRARWFGRALLNRCTRPFEFVPLACNRQGRADDWRHVQTCNLAVWRSDCEEINGFDERYFGHGLEDSDFALRLIRKGVRRKRGDHASIVLHLHHERRRRPAVSRNSELFAELLANDRFFAANGLRRSAVVAVGVHEAAPTERTPAFPWPR